MGGTESWINDQILKLLEILAIAAGGTSLVFAVRGNVTRLTDAIRDLKEAVKDLNSQLAHLDNRLRRHADRLRDIEWKVGLRHVRDIEDEDDT